MAQTVNCPNCDAPLPLDPSRPSLHCDYCKSDVINPAHALRGARQPARKTGLIIALAASGGLVAVGGLTAMLVFSGARSGGPTTVSVTAPASTRPRRTLPPRPPPKPRGPRVRQVLSTDDVTGDGIADLAFGSWCTSAQDNNQTCSVGLIDGAAGKLVWHKTYLTTTRASTARVACHGVLVAQDNTRSIVGYEASNGAQRWRLTLSDFIRSTGAPAGTAARPVCLFATEDRSVSAVDVKSGKLLWRRDGGSPWGLREVLSGDNTVVFKDSSAALDLFTGAPRETGIKAKQRGPHSWRARISLAGAYAYTWARRRRNAKIAAYSAQGWKLLGQLEPPKVDRLGLYPLGGRMLLLNPFKPPTSLALLDGAKLVGPLVVSEDEGVAQARIVGETILLLTINTRGTRRTTLRAYDLKLEGELWNAQLDASGKEIKFITKGPNFGGHGSSASGGGALIAAAQGRVLLELSPKQQQARLSLRDLRSGKVQGEVLLPVRGHWKDHSKLNLIRTGPGRAFLRYDFGSEMIVAVDPATRKVVWTYDRR